MNISMCNCGNEKLRGAALCHNCAVKYREKEEQKFDGLEIKEITGLWARRGGRDGCCGASLRICLLTNGKYAVVDVEVGDDIFGNNPCDVENIIFPLYETIADAEDVMYSYT